MDIEDDNFSETSSVIDKSDDDSVDNRKKVVKKKVAIASAIDAQDSDMSDAESDMDNSDADSDMESDLEDLEGDDNAPIPTRAMETAHFPDIESDDDDNEEDEDYFQKLNENVQQNILQEHHPELAVNNYEEIEALCTIVRDENGMIVDPLHKTIPYVTRYEKARVLGERAKQLNAGAPAFIEVEKNIIDGYLIALRELEAKKIPFIVQRPLPNGGCEYWHLRDLEVL